MNGAFLDTTVVVHIAERVAPLAARAERFIASNQPAEVPFYALRELLDGRIRLLCDAHNVLLGAQNIGEAMLALLSRNPAEGRKREARQQELARILSCLYDKNPTGSRADMKREALDALALKISQLWRRARRLKMVSEVQPLGCFNDGMLSFGPSDELRGPSGSFTCLKKERCAAAAYLYDNQAALARMIEALHPSKLNLALANKNETKQRRRALQELSRSGPVKFNKSSCRALGDAYFAAMCPPGSIVVTSNTSDHKPLCEALGKHAAEP